ncbi:MAG TPA: type II secretion system protein [Patescibacteria group bacterium]|nr:type II secretion system protein [Patescibacteria group bacterium]
MSDIRKNQQGITFLELIIVLSIIGVLLSVSTINTSNLFGKTTFATTTETLIADIKQQQIKAMVGDAEGRGSTSDYGVNFEQGRYTLFHGATYDPMEPSNIRIDLSPQMQFSAIGFANSFVTFGKLSGEVQNFDPASNFFTLEYMGSNERKTFYFNRYGSLYGLN